MIDDEFPDELDYETSAEANVAIIRAIIRAMSEIVFMQKMRRLMPLVAQELVKAGVDFSKVKTPGDDNEVTEVYPARVRFRGFDRQSEEEGFIGLTEYLQRNVDGLVIESKE